MSVQIHIGNALSVLQTLSAASVHCCVTSPPYWGLRDYRVADQLGLERTPDEYVAKMVAVFREVRRVLRDDGTLWLNLGDCYAGSGSSMIGGQNSKEHGRRADRMIPTRNTGAVPTGLKQKDLVGIPWRFAFALQKDGWWLRSDIIWAKPNPMPESVTDRPTRSHEYLFLLTKSARYYYDAEAVAEPFSDERMGNPGGDGHYVKEAYTGVVAHQNPQSGLARGIWNEDGQRKLRNRRSVWTIATKPYAGAHFATFPPELPEICIKAGCPDGGTVLDPFAGAGTTLLVADRLGRNGIGIELNPQYVALSRKRIHADAPLFASVEVNGDESGSADRPEPCHGRVRAWPLGRGRSKRAHRQGPVWPRPRR